MGLISKLLIFSICLITFRADGFSFNVSREADYFYKRVKRIRQAQLQIYTQDVTEQESFKNVVSFKEALDISLNNFLFDATDKKSPLNIAYEVAKEEMQAECDEEKKCDVDNESKVWSRAKQILRLDLDQRSTVITLLPFYESREHFTRPQNGEKVRDNWIFTFYLESLSSEVFWVIVDRAGKNEAYNYGSR